MVKSALQKRLNFRLLFWIVALVFGIFQLWVYRYSPSSVDIVSYLDISDFYLQGKWNAAINSYWSPLYSWSLGLARMLTTTDPYWEIVIVKLTNFIFYLIAFACFEIFLSECFKRYQKEASSNSSYGISKASFFALGYSLFLWSTLTWTGIYCDTPDVCMSALMYLAVALLLRIEHSPKNWLNFLLLGLVLGLGYLSRAAIFYVSFAFFIAAMLSTYRAKRALPKIGASLLVFVLVVAPFITAISLKEGHFTVSTAGKLNQAWKFGYIRDKHWQGETSENGVPAHPTRKIFDNPNVFEFATPVEGTFSPWIDPAYWYKGLKFKADWSIRRRIILRNIAFYWDIFLGSLTFSYLILAIASDRLKHIWSDLRRNWLIWAPAIAGLALFALATRFPSSDFPVLVLQPSTRFLTPFISLLLVGCLTSIQFPNAESGKKLILGFTVAALVFMNGSLIYQGVSKGLDHLENYSAYTDWEISNYLREYGVKNGDQIAIIGDDNQSYLLWARLDKLKIVAQIPSQDEFWSANLDTQKKALESIHKIGAKAVIRLPHSIVYWPNPSRIDLGRESNWKSLGDTGYSVYVF